MMGYGFTAKLQYGEKALSGPHHRITAQMKDTIFQLKSLFRLFQKRKDSIKVWGAAWENK